MQDLIMFIEDYPEYVPKKGEDYMNPEMLNHFKQKLRAWKQQLIQETGQTVEHLKTDSEIPADPNDRASLEEEFSLELRARDRERKLISKIDKSLRDIETGDYGFCEISNEEIGLKRMEARPTANLTVEQKRKEELKEKQGIV